MAIENNRHIIYLRNRKQGPHHTYITSIIIILTMIAISLYTSSPLRALIVPLITYLTFDHFYFKPEVGRSLLSFVFHDIFLVKTDKFKNCKRINIKIFIQSLFITLYILIFAFSTFTILKSSNPLLDSLRSENNKILVELPIKKDKKGRIIATAESNTGRIITHRNITTATLTGFILAIFSVLYWNLQNIYRSKWLYIADLFNQVKFFEFENTTKISNIILPNSYKEQLSAQIEIKKILLVINIVRMDMWSNKSFSQYTNNIIEKAIVDNNSLLLTYKQGYLTTSEAIDVLYSYMNDNEKKLP